ncbi:hypothetical protein EJB05_37022, partial [Eragrostis curvula]
MGRIYGRPEPLEEEYTVPALINSTSVDESKLYLVFCTMVHCSDDPQSPICFKCITGDKVYNTRDDCRAPCLKCDPECDQTPPSPSAVTERSTLAAVTNATL